jgi:hypothetical protein
MIQQFKAALKNNLLNIPGWKTRRKLIVFESDDWGSIRMPSKEAYLELLNDGLKVDKHPYSKFDCLESEDDLTALFEVLTSHKDKKGNHPVITANAIMANPDFDKIKESGFRQYYYELFTETFKRYPRGHKRSFELWEEGIAAKVFVPQLHGREHLNVYRWMEALQAGSIETLKAFDLQMFGIPSNITAEKRKSYMAAFDFDNEAEKSAHNEIIRDAAKIFEDTLGYKAVSFIAPNYTWHADLEKTLAETGIKTIQSTKHQNAPQGGENYKRILHYTGQVNTHNQIITLRNCLFEPSESNSDWVNKCLKNIEVAFRWNKPAIISTHRLNFIGSVFEENRTNNLKMLDSLLSKILVRWPEAEFISSADLAAIINNEK